MRPGRVLATMIINSTGSRGRLRRQIFRFVQPLPVTEFVTAGEPSCVASGSPGRWLGNDPLNNTQSSGILSFLAARGTLISGNTVRANDMGIYTDDGITIRDNKDSGNRSVGIYVDTDATGAHITGNTTNSDGVYGIAIGPAFPAGIGTPNPGGNFFTGDTAFGNSSSDLWQSPDAGPNSNRDNRCGTATPSRSY
jgi:hypothetical protein